MSRYSWGRRLAAAGAGGGGLVVFTDSELNARAAAAEPGAIQPDHLGQRVSGPYRGGELVKPLTLYVRGDEQVLARGGICPPAAEPGNKKTTLVKHHKAIG
jgi:hypothetical protein